MLDFDPHFRSRFCDIDLIEALLRTLIFLFFSCISIYGESCPNMSQCTILKSLLDTLLCSLIIE